MALTIDEISAITEKMYLKLIADNAFNSNPVTHRLWQRGPKVDGGRGIHAPLLYAKIPTAGAVRGAETFAVDTSDEITAVVFDWKEYYAALVISRREKLQNSGVAQVVNLIEAKSQIAEMTLRDLMGTGVYSDGASNTKLIDGLDAAIDTTGTYPNSGGESVGINRAVETWWKAGFRGTGTTLFGGAMTALNAPQFLQAAFGKVTQQPNSPTLIVIDQEGFDVIHNSFFDTSSGRPWAQIFEDQAMASLGFQTILFRGVPIVVDSHVTTGSGTSIMYVLNENFLQLFTHQDENFYFDPFREPINQKAMVAKIYWTGNMVCNNPRFMARINYDA